MQQPVKKDLLIMFSSQHFIWLAIAAAVAVGMLVCYKKCKLSFDTVLNIMLVISVVSEVTKILSNLEPSGHSEGGLVLDPGDLPFHLCSIQIFFMFALKFILRSGSAKEKLLAFMCPTMIIGAVCALLIPTVGTSFAKPQVYQYFIYHASLIFFAIYIICERLVKWSLVSYLRNLGYLGMCALLCTWINSALIKSVNKINFMYLVRPPMENLPILNLDNGWLAYFLTLVGLAVSLLALFHIAVILPPYLRAKRDKT